MSEFGRVGSVVNILPAQFSHVRDVKYWMPNKLLIFLIATFIVWVDVVTKGLLVLRESPFIAAGTMVCKHVTKAVSGIVTHVCAFTCLTQKNKTISIIFFMDVCLINVKIH